MVGDASAPPIIPVHKTPDTAPCPYDTEFRARENITDHIIDKKNPTAGKAITATSLLPNIAAIKQALAATLKPCNTRLALNSFNNTIPNKQLIEC